MEQETLDNKHDSKCMQQNDEASDMQQGIITLPTYSRSALQTGLHSHAWVPKLQFCKSRNMVAGSPQGKTNVTVVLRHSTTVTSVFPCGEPATVSLKVSMSMQVLKRKQKHK